MEKKIIRILIVLFILSVIGIGLALIYVNKKSKFVKPELDNNAVNIVENIDEILNYSELKVKDGYIIGLCSKIKVKEDRTINIYFASYQENDVYLKLRLLNENENIIAETGLIKPGQCIEEIKLDENIKYQRIIAKIMSYNPETYCSEGSVKLKLEIEK